MSRLQLQYFWGPKQPSNVLFATVLLIPVLPAGWAALAALAMRLAWERHASKENRAHTEPGDASFNLLDSMR